MVKHLWFWVIMTMIAVFIMPALVSPTTYQARIYEEVTLLERTFGQEAAAQVIAITENAYSSLFEESGFRQWIMQHYYVDAQAVAQGGRESGAPGGMAAQLSQNYVVSLFENLYELTFRITQVFIWGVYSLPFILAAMLDGAMQRKAKIVSFSYSSPSVYNASWHFIIALIFCGFFYFNTPFPVPPITFPVAIGVLAFSLRSLVANLQRSA